MKKISVAFMLTFAFLALIVVPVAAATTQQENPSTLDGFLLWLVAGGSVIAVSWVLEQVDWFQSLPSKSKRIVQYALSALVGLVALAVQTYVPDHVLSTLAPFFAVLASTFGMVFLNQAAHTLDPHRIETPPNTNL